MKYLTHLAGDFMEKANHDSFRSLELKIEYCGFGGEILREFVRPLLGRAIQYDRITSFFTTHSLLAIADGIESLRQKQGKMRLILGIHDVPQELARAACSDDEYIAALIRTVNDRLFSQIRTIEDELIKDRLAAIAWMMKDGLLQVRVAAPLPIYAADPGIVHNKSFLFRDNEGNIVAAVGSPNETVAGLGHNYEEINVFMSWKVSIEYVQKQVDKFESFWNGLRPGLIVRELDREFAEHLLTALGRTAAPSTIEEPSRDDMLIKVLDNAAKMPLYGLVSGSICSLFPHQERAYVDALSRWPLRVLLADEVGLGKTIEAGAVIEYAIRFRRVRRVVVLAPKGVLPQWQEELKQLFGLDFWIYDSSARVFYDFSGTTKQKEDGPILSEDAPDLILISAQYARGRRGTRTLFEDALLLPEMLIVDEAHAARTRPDLNGNISPTRMWRMLDGVARKVPHLILLTATPMQIDWHEYHALLNLLGLPGRWERPEAYERSLSLLVDRGAPSLDKANKLVELSLDVIKDMDPFTGHLDSEEKELLRCLKISTSSFQAASIVQGSWVTAVSVFTKMHPAHLLTIRNTRSVLQELGYKFPERALEAPQLIVSDDVQRLQQTIEEYLKSGYYSVEKALYPGKSFNAGFVLCMYQQRLASSFEACRLSLERRRNKIVNIDRGLTWQQEVDEAADIDLEEETGTDASDNEDAATAPIINEDVKRAINIEKAYIDDILHQLQRALRVIKDPKLTELVTILNRHILQGDRILVFSRYTDTLDAAVEAFRSKSGMSIGYAYYTGPESWIDIDNERQPASRTAVKEALKKGLVKVVFCSDAATEGLNLQTARVLVNIDVPWNPARLEQRIGRIARLGQLASSVTIYNLWYPNSVEAKIYSRLMQRKDLYDLAVGQFPEIVSQAIKDELSRNLIPSEFETQTQYDPIQRLQDMRKNMQLSALSKIWRIGVSAKPMTGELRKKLIGLVLSTLGCDKNEAGQVVCMIKGKAITVSDVPGEPECISLSHPVLRVLPSVVLGKGKVMEMGLLEDEMVPAFFALKDSSGHIWVLKQEALTSLIEAVVKGSPIFLGMDTMLFSIGNDMPKKMPQEIKEYFSWLPVINKIRVPTGTLILNMPRDDGLLTFRSLGLITVTE